MSKNVYMTCDWCRTNAEVNELEDPIEMGWISTESYDIMKSEIVDNDFCTKECLLAYFND